MDKSTEPGYFRLLYPVVESQALSHSVTFRNFCERMGRSKEITEVDCGAVIVCRYCKRSVCNIFFLSISTVNSVIAKRKHLQAITLSGNANRTQKCQCSAEPQTSFRINISIKLEQRELRSMSFHD